MCYKKKQTTSYSAYRLKKRCFFLKGCAACMSSYSRQYISRQKVDLYIEKLNCPEKIVPAHPLMKKHRFLVAS